MSDSESAPVSLEFYPDIAAAGSLAAAVERVAAELGLDLGTVQIDEDDPLRTAGVVSFAAGREPAWLGMADTSRWLWILGRWQGIDLLDGDDDELVPLVRAAEAWRRGATLREIQQVCPYVEVNELLEAHERGPAEAVAVKWRQLLAGLREDADGFQLTRGALNAAELAFAEPVLRGLYPVTGHWALDFLSSTGDPAVFNVPTLQPLHDGRYRVTRPAGGPLIGEVDTAEEAVALVLAHVPKDLGPATAGGPTD